MLSEHTFVDESDRMPNRLIRGSASRTQRTNFRRQIDGFTPSLHTLGMTHLTSSYNLRDIVETKRIEAIEKCAVLEEKLTYAFYGRAAFRPSHDTQPTNLRSLAPTVLILDPAKTPEPKYVLPFDSGAFMHGFLDSYLTPYMPLFDFLLSPTVTAASKLISNTFGSNANFLQNTPLHLEETGTNFEYESYLKIVYACSISNSSELDDRVSTPELAFDTPIDLTKSVCAAIVPDKLSADANIGGALRSMGISVIEYCWRGGTRPGEMHGVIRGLVEQVYDDKGWK